MGSGGIKNPIAPRGSGDLEKVEKHCRTLFNRKQKRSAAILETRSFSQTPSIKSHKTTCPGVDVVYGFRVSGLSSLSSEAPRYGAPETTGPGRRVRKTARTSTCVHVRSSPPHLARLGHAGPEVQGKGLSGFKSRCVFCVSVNICRRRPVPPGEKRQLEQYASNKS